MKYRSMKSPMRHLGMDWYFVADKDPKIKPKQKLRLSTMMMHSKYPTNEVTLDKVEEVYNELNSYKPGGSSFKSQTSPPTSKRENSSPHKREYKPAWYLPVDKWTRNSTEEADKYDFMKGN